MPPFKDLTGQKFAMLTVIQRVEDDASSHVRYLCKCDCGKTVIVRGDSLTRNHSKSCGCFKDEKLRNNKWHMKHGKHNTRLYSIWAAMKRRCNNPNVLDFKNYGGRGIKVCKEWQENFESFFEWAILNGYNDILTIERKDVNKPYNPSNCKWATIKEQNRNKRDTYYVTYNKETRPLCEWSEIIGIKYSVLWRRISRDNWSVERAFTTPVRSTKG